MDTQERTTHIDKERAPVVMLPEDVPCSCERV